MAPIFIFLLLPTSPANSDAPASAAFATPKTYFKFQPVTDALERKQLSEAKNEMNGH